MMKRLFAALLSAISIFAALGEANAQRRSTVSGVVADADTREALIGVVLGFTPAADSVATNNIVSGAGGTFSIGLNSGEWDIKTMLIGYEPISRRVEVTGTRTVLDTLFVSSGIEIEAIMKRAVTIRTSVSGDTLIYNADSYKVAADANVSGLLAKMPGLKVEDGVVEAQGEAVRKVLIDGREFFGEDVNAAISSLPAEVVKSIEVFDKLSDNAEFTGIDDGEGYKAINITTRESMRQGVMGQVSALYGAGQAENRNEPWRHYGMAGGNVSIFQGDAKITVGGTFNNLNERHFTSEDILGAGDNNGIGNVGRLQLNYIDIWGKKDQWKVDGTYSYGITAPKNHNIIDREYFEGNDALYRNYYSETRRETNDQEHRFRSRIDFKPNEFHELRIRPSVSFQDNRYNSSGYGIYYPVDGSEGINLDSWNTGKGKGWNTGLGLNYRVRLGKPGRVMSFFFDGGYGSTDRTNESYSERQNGDKRQVRTPSLGENYNLRGGLTYNEPVGKNALVNLDYNFSYRYSDQDRKSYLWALPNGSSIWEEGDYDMTVYDTELSGIFNSGYWTHRIGPGYRMKGDKTTFSAGVSYQYSTLESDRVLPVTTRPHIAADFSNVTYSVLIDTKLGDKDYNLWMRLNSNTRNPDLGDLQDVVDISNLQNISKGNSELRPSYNNELRGRIILPNVEKGRTLSFNFGGNYMMNAIARRTVRDSPGYNVLDSNGNVVETLDAVGRYTEPVNMDGAWSARFGVGYGFPVSFLKSNLNLNADVSYNQSPSQTGTWKPEMAAPVFSNNFRRETSTGGGISLGSNISEKVDFYVRYNIRYYDVHNTYFSSSDNEYLRHTVSADFKFVLPLNFTISGNLYYYNYNSISGQNFNQQYFIANAGIGKKVFRSGRGEVSIFVNDIFNQNVGFFRQVADQYIQNSTNSIIGRYAGVKFTWNIRKFGKNGSQNIDMYDIEDGHGHGGHQDGGRPQGGGGYRY